MPPLSIEVTRGPLVESVHRVSAVVVDPDDRLIASTGDPHLVTFWRSAAKPFQAMPLLQDGAAERFGLDDADLALACASHSSEPHHLAAVDRLLGKVGVRETDLACGPHEPLDAGVARTVVAQGITMTARWSNCSGKHTGLLAQAKHRGWPLAGYQRAGHPLQDRLLAEVSRWTGVPSGAIATAIDGCTTVCFGVSLRAMALAYARLGTSPDPAAVRIRTAMMKHPELVAGTGRSCTDLMRAWPGELLVKIGAEGVYSAAIPSLKLGVAVKVEDGDLRSVAIALIAVVRQLLERHGGFGSVVAALEGLKAHSEPEIRSTRGELVGNMGASGALAFS